MNPHNVTNEQLVQFVLGELSGAKAGEIEAHLGQCAPCRQAVGRLQSLLDCAGRMASLPAEEKTVQSANREVLLAAGTENEDQSRHRIQSPVALFGRTIMKNRITKLALAAGVILAVMAGLSLFTGGGSGKVYARMVDQLHNVGTLTYSLITMTGVETMPTVRMNIAFKEPGLLRTATADGYVTVIDATDNRFRGISLVPDTRNYITFDSSNMPDKAGGDPWVSVEKLQTLPAEADELLGRQKIDGRTLEGFRIREDDTTITVWIDPAGGALVRAELEFARAPGMNMILSDFQFDVPLDDSLFSIEPPDGFTPMAATLQTDMSQVSERDLVEFLRLWSGWTVDRTFPPTVLGTEIGKIAIQMGREGRFASSDAPGYSHDQQAQIMYRGMLFIGLLPNGTWRYAGQNVSFGDPLTPVFWYQPQGSATWRVIYADLSVKDVAPADLPK